eukprot:g4560.t1
MLKGYNTSYDFSTETGGFARRMARYCGVANFIFAFIFGHMINSKPSAAVRTAVMVFGLYLAVNVHTIYFDEQTTPKARQASMKNLYITSAFFLGGVITLVTMDSPTKTKNQ